MEFFPISRGNGGPEIACTSIFACLVPFREERLEKFKALATEILFSPWPTFFWIVRLARHTFGVLWWEGINATFLVTKKDERNKVTKEEPPGPVWRVEARHPSLTYLLYCTVYNKITTKKRKKKKKCHTVAHRPQYKLRCESPPAKPDRVYFSWVTWRLTPAVPTILPAFQVCKFSWTLSQLTLCNSMSLNPRDPLSLQLSKSGCSGQWTFSLARYALSSCFLFWMRNDLNYHPDFELELEPKYQDLSLPWQRQPQPWPRPLPPWSLWSPQ